jgi:hypothetical protein
MRHTHIYSLLSVSLLFLAISHLSPFSPIYVIPVLALYLAFSFPKEDYVVWAMPLMLLVLMVVLTYYETPSILLYDLESRVVLLFKLLIIITTILAGRYFQSRNLVNLLNFMILLTIVKWICMSSILWLFIYPKDASFSVYQADQIQALLRTIPYNIIFITLLEGISSITSHTKIRSRIWT